MVVQSIIIFLNLKGHIQYNIGAKLVDESIPIIEKMGFKLATPRFSSNGPDADYHFIKI
jgi:hypothetical protein